MPIINDPSIVLPDTAAAMIWLGLDPADTDALNENQRSVVSHMMYLSQAAENGELRYYDKKLFQEIPIENTQRTEKVFSYFFTMQSLMDFAKSKNHRLETQTREKTADALLEKPLSAADPANTNPTGDAPHGTRWPDHETGNLRALRMAAVHFWSRYDQSDISTAHKNEEVSAWLQENHGISETLANAMATILRPDGLRKGPR